MNISVRVFSVLWAFNEFQNDYANKVVYGSPGLAPPASDISLRRNMDNTSLIDIRVYFDLCPCALDRYMTRDLLRSPLYESPLLFPCTLQRCTRKNIDNQFMWISDFVPCLFLALYIIPKSCLSFCQLLACFQPKSLHLKLSKVQFDHRKIYPLLDQLTESANDDLGGILRQWHRL